MGSFHWKQTDSSKRYINHKSKFSEKHTHRIVPCSFLCRTFRGASVSFAFLLQCHHSQAEMIGINLQLVRQSQSTN